MKSSRIMPLLILFCLCLFLVSTADTASGQTKAPVRPALSNDDCVKCHEGPPADIESAGKKHKTITCQDCHAGHPPKVKKPIPACSQCHQGKKHYEVKGCLTCHRNPHTPLNIKFPDNTTEACLSCHDAQIRQLRDNKSRHTALSCTTCHGSTHRFKPECVKCHKPHAQDMAASECGKCHKAHMPTVVAYGDVPSKLCASCHRKAFDLLSAGTVKHKNLNCSFCHQAKHKAMARCQDCHGIPHPAGIMKKFPNCSECHKTAHDLNNWNTVMKKEPAKKR